jgi:hypothetical protein
LAKLLMVLKSTFCTTNSPRTFLSIFIVLFRWCCTSEWDVASAVAVRGS